MLRYKTPILFASVLMFLVGAANPAAAQEGAWRVIDSAKGLGAFGFLDISCSGEDDCVYVADSGGYASLCRRTTDGGKTWRTVLSDTLVPGKKWTKIGYQRVSHPTAGQIMVLADSNYIFNTFDGGNTWDTIQYFLPFGRFSLLEFADTNHGYVAGPPNLMQFSPNGGKDWVANSQVFADGFSFQDLAVAPGRVVAVLMVKPPAVRVAYSRDNGLGWRIFEGPQNYFRLDFSDAAHGCMIGFESVGQGDRGLDLIAITKDSGRTWKEVMHQWNDPAYGLLEVSFADSLHGLAVGRLGKILRTTDGGETWRQESFGCDTTGFCNIIRVEMPSPRVAYALVFLGRMIRYDSESMSVDVESHNDEGFSLVVAPQPAPAAGSLSATLTLQRGGLVRTRLFTITGESLYTGEQFYEAGVHHVPLPIASRSGNYILRVEVGPYFATRRIVIVE